MVIKNDKERVIRKSVNLFMTLFVLIGALLCGVIAIFYRSELNTFVSEMKVREKYTLELQSTVIGDEFDSIISDLLFLANQNELLDYCNSYTHKDAQGIAAEYEVMVKTKRVYDQIRYLNVNGQELVRVNWTAGVPVIVSNNLLQDKSKRYYFRDSIRLKDKEIFASPLDLNIEHGSIERPFKPMIRFGTPVFDDKGTKKGIVLLNYLAENLLKRINSIDSGDHNDKMLLNVDGYWLLSPNKKDEWGFMFEDMNKVSFAAKYPEEWKVMRNALAGQFQTRNGLFTFNKIFPLQESFRSSSGLNAPYSPSVKSLNPLKYYWILVSYVSPEIMADYSRTLMLRLFLFGAGLFISISFGAWSLALAITKRRIYEAQLLSMALYDSLTKLPNRKLFFDRLSLSLKQAERYKRKLGLLYIDLEEFKKVNDTLGHEAGDELLILVGSVLKSCLRKSDTVARLGGDEFVAILPEINGVGDCKLAGDKIVEALKEPFKLKHGTIYVGASIGVAVCPDHGTTCEQLIKRADMDMYEVKKSRKDRCVIAEANE